ncbi:polyhydroxyalkanoate depolymerase [Sphingomonas koreensis]|uniref:Esterase n=1 Tax=Sphingomonas koreensis TaxID=93064 RepID=A0A1L6JES5_9SPHN|nr:polyhydroxyalkanoate depolymerase [Sphingomonas koreensis]APR54413.1 esterase [Sphingomonas koreensis]RSU20615.1 polyhydroxyalkanoate depolymerase [Sphingomonas koreensis]RSU28689.1 polyhydroxyalkanoate depolymerase [Sphingomonas koreensis]RSU29798.1 polyhydroxyalkanoate depolymerase [Sphingomonas koreensis]RSU36293.1 polyhydroxyalkanoate depolymerase [Sphingomonas koreensis]
MLYDAYEMQRSMLAGASALANFSAGLLNNPANPFAYFGGGPILASALEVFAHAAAPRGKPDFGLDFTTIDGKRIDVREEIVLRKPFGQLKRFVREGVEGGPKLLIVAPMSGHFATLLRGTVERMLPTADVYITDWWDARQVPLSDGRFDLDDYVDYVIEFMAAIGAEGDQRAHVLAVCQPSVPVYAAVALMNADKHPNRPRTLTMMGGPIDTREAPTAVNTLATERPHAWFAQNVIATVPATYPGAGRRVYPGFLQLAGFMTMNLGSHMISHWEMFKHLVKGDGESADSTMRFYDEYRAVCDMTAEFYLQTIDVVFQAHSLPKGEMMHRGRRVDPGAITDTALLAVEGERDDISGLGQTKAALTIAAGLPARMKKYHMAPAVGHYGIFNGSKWRTKIAPVLEEWIAKHSA